MGRRKRENPTNFLYEVNILISGEDFLTVVDSVQRIIRLIEKHNGGYSGPVPLKTKRIYSAHSGSKRPKGEDFEELKVHRRLVEARMLPIPFFQEMKYLVLSKNVSLAITDKLHKKVKVSDFLHGSSPCTG